MLFLLFALFVASLAVPSYNFKSISGSMLQFSVSNPDGFDLRVLKWGTPFEGIKSDMFTVSHLHQYTGPKTYLGILMKRGDPITEDFLIVPSYSTVSIEFDLDQTYHFDSIGKYLVTLNLPTYSGVFDFEAQTKQVIVDISKVTVPRNHTRPLGYVGCNAAQNGNIDQSISPSLSEARRAYNCMASRSSSCLSLAVKWFGVYDATRYSYDQNTVLGAIVSHMSSKPFHADCFASQCSANTYAYVYPSDSTFTVHLCNLFFTIPGERLQTIIHEMSHFNSLGATKDYAYGQSACQNLARSNPAQASHNADNVCYFASEAR